MIKEFKSRIIGAVEGEPLGHKTWSGSSPYFFKSMEKTGSLIAAVSVQPSREQILLNKLMNFDLNFKKWKFNYHNDVKSCNSMTNVALEKIKKLENVKYNTILQIGTMFDLTCIKDKLKISYNDGNLAQMINSHLSMQSPANANIRSKLSYEQSINDRLDHIFTLSQYLKDSFIKYYNINPEKITVAGAGINLPYTKEIKDRDYSLRRILFIGYEFERKGGKALLEAFKIVRKEISDAKLIIIGPQLTSCPEGVECLGFLNKNSDKDLEALINEYVQASFFVMPSLYEPFGIVFLEAMAHKLPCIGTNICAMPEIIEDGKTGFLVPPDDPITLAERMIELLKSPKMMKEFGENGYDKYLNFFNWDSVISKILSKTDTLL